MRKRFSTIVFLLIVGVVAAQPLSKTEKKIVDGVDAAMPATIALLKESVNINSGTLNIEGVKQTGRLYAKELEALGFTVTWITMPDSLKRPGTWLLSAKERKAKNFF